MGRESNIIGIKTEKTFSDWLNQAGIPFFYVGQKQTIPSRAIFDVFKAKRPDFVILVQRTGMFLVDVKGNSLYRLKQCFNLKPDDVENYSNLEKHFSFKLFIIFYDIKEDKDNFYWISMHRVNEVKIKDKIPSKNGSFHWTLRIPIAECTKIGLRDDQEAFFKKFSEIK